LISSLQQRLPAGWLNTAATWALPLFTVALVRRSSTDGLQLLIAALLATGIIILASRWPVGALCTLFFLFPLRDVVFSALFRLGVSGSIVRQAGLWKELLVAALVVAAFRGVRATGGPASGRDLIALGIVAIAVVYFVAPGIPGSVAAPYDARVGSLRSDAGFAVLFIACRRLVLDDRDKRRLVMAITASALVLAASGLWQYLSPAAFDHFMINTIRLPFYKQVVLRSPFKTISITLATRPGGFLVDAPLLAEGLILPLAIGSSRIVRPSANPLWYFATAVFATSILLTASRGAALAAALVLLLTLRRAGSAALTATRTRYALVLVATIVVVAPFLLQSQLAHRARAAVAGRDLSAQTHSSQLTNSTRIFFTHPFGLGLGIGTASRSARTGAYISEDAYLQIGNEIGALPMVLFAALVVTTIAGLARVDDPSPLAGGAFCAGMAIALISLFTNAWIDVNVSWVFWAVAGLVLVDRPHRAGSDLLASDGLPSHTSASLPHMPTRFGRV
jgi:hypothetical protein